MKATTLFLAVLSILTASSPSGEIWGGKWSNSFLVFIHLEQDADGNWKSIYRHKEYTAGELSEASPAKDANMEGDIIKVGANISLRLDKNHGIAYGNFTNPRDAYVVKIKETDISKVSDKDIMEAGWTRDLMTIEESKKYVFEKEGTIKLGKAAP